eukprot:CAMPEP_0175005116 /NCGR_PEP_ID=MMETSP0005-20121125/5136_1 /TAXON_ID=420556 /ORGANISM="Ochromonas sp., Strain CCMP1393" /LENGTH=63 /DNA_ID=CAMNT_0016260329 /DNA_START=26 /DNA_END=217 /DNA_ORIENTATION=-
MHLLQAAAHQEQHPHLVANLLLLVHRWLQQVAKQLRGRHIGNAGYEPRGNHLKLQQHHAQYCT